MEDDRKPRPGEGVSVNDNNPASIEIEGGDALVRRGRLERVVLDVARLIGRQIAREEFERIGADNDNRPKNPPREK
ncbi:hypothetical protein G6L29_15485 [Agrobacterium rhizogenes]|uniref:hypothetical protein n=1 Tax=Rhizobium rhizogenes TaxID=359 RepID=UPI001571709B|nr:hypothetical protein [Rhizobium rhizogenes]NTI17042.1 hypothetical protein [Rhizobium rhizogenes]